MNLETKRQKSHRRNGTGRKIAQAVAVLVVFSLVGAWLALIFTPFLDFSSVAADVAVAVPREPDRSPEKLGIEHYLPPSPEEAPEAIRIAVLAGYRIALGQTREPGGAIRSHPGSLTCNSCHFRGGLTDGGKNDGFSLVGSSAQFPSALADGSSIDLAGRINRCLVYHMGREPWPCESSRMREMIAYLTWISKGVPQYAELSWLEVQPLHDETDRQDTSIDSVELFKKECSICHGKEGEGTPIAPPLWGEGSFLAGSEMAQSDILARFIFMNMPKGTSRSLGPQQSIAMARFVLEHARERLSLNSETKHPAFFQKSFRNTLSRK